VLESYEELSRPTIRRPNASHSPALARFVVNEVTPELVDSLMATTLVGHHGLQPAEGQKVRPTRAASR